MGTNVSHEEDADSNSSLANTPEDILKTMSGEDLYRLLTDIKTWEAFVDEKLLSRNEAEEIYEALSRLITDLATEDKKVQEFRERFLRSYPQLKQQLRNDVDRLHELAVKADTIHRNCTISKVVADSTGIVSGILTIAGLGLAPVTAGASLSLAAAGVGLGTASAVTTVSTSVLESVSMSSIEAEANKCSAGSNLENLLKELLSNAGSIGGKLYNGLNNIGKINRVIKLVKSQPHLAARAARFASGGKVSFETTRQVRKAFGGTALAMTKSARIFGAVTAGITTLMDVASLVKNAKELQEGAKAPSAENLRHQAQELKKMLEVLSQIYQSLSSS
ncbi:apolipoprotein L3-like [Talpa occidentalis]|uniref:apolipoprotein L3-like n=1 Tax=Talpa occidentalis TaxID=50954 RepID=UPI00188EDA16|nr:apolipoprotein L3-like [Talpa occidentalis]